MEYEGKKYRQFFMRTHLEHLVDYVPNLISLKVLDLGSGRGDFVIDLKKRGCPVVGLEKNPSNIALTHDKASRLGLIVDVVEGVGEKLPFKDGSFDFINVCEVIEHVEDPHLLLQEIYRVLSPGGLVYLSIPNRFGVKDQHFHLYFVNWLPRIFANHFISIFGSHKDYSGQSGRQNLKDMHYYTKRGITHLVKKIGFSYQDMREIKISRKFTHGISCFLATIFYRFLSFWYFDSFHLLLKKSWSP